MLWDMVPFKRHVQLPDVCMLLHLILINMYAKGLRNYRKSGPSSTQERIYHHYMNLHENLSTTVSFDPKKYQYRLTGLRIVI